MSDGYTPVPIRPDARRAGTFLLAAISVQQSVWLASPIDPRPSLAFAVLGLTLVLAGLFAPVGVLPRIGVRGLRRIAALGVIVGTARLPFVVPFIGSVDRRDIPAGFVMLAVAAGGLGLVVTLDLARLARRAFPFLMAAFLGLTVWDVRLMPPPHNDVVLFQMESVSALLHGRNPYAITFPNLYGPQTAYYRPELLSNGRFQSGYDYPPLTLLADLPGYAAGDVRYTEAAASAIAAGAVAYGLGPPVGLPFAALMLLAPGSVDMVVHGYVEPVLTALLAVAAVLTKRGGRPGLTAATVGLLLASKQYVPLALPALALVVPRPGPAARRWVAVALAAAVTVTAPLFVVGPVAFVRSLTVPFVSFTRPDSISFMPWLVTLVGRRFALALPTGMAVPIGIAVARWAPRTPAGFAAGVSATMLCVFLVGTQAFANYYWFIAAAAVLAAAVAVGPGSEIIPAAVAPSESHPRTGGQRAAEQGSLTAADLITDNGSSP